MIKVNNLVKYYGDFKAVDKISFEIKKGEIVGILGPNGAGKSSAIRILCGYQSSTEGSVFIDNNEISENLIEIKNKIGYLPESAPIYPEMMVYDYLEYIAKIRKIPKLKIVARIKEIAELCGLKIVMHKNISEISKGYKQRVGLAHALIGNPDILILDEPTTGLDPNQIVEIRKLIKEIGKEKTVLLCSHILSEVEATCSRIIILSKGQIVADDLTENMINQEFSQRTIFLEFQGGDSEKIETYLKSLSFVDSVNRSELGSSDVKSYKLIYGGENDRRKDLMDNIISENFPIVSFYQEKRSLENVFRELTPSSGNLTNHLKKNDSIEVNKITEKIS